MTRQQKKDCEETCDYSDASAAVKQEGLEWEIDCVIAHSFYRVYCNALFLSCTLDYKNDKVLEDVFKGSYTVAMEQQNFSWWNDAAW